MNKAIRDDFPILNRTIYNRQLVYLDNAATTQKPRQVVEAIADEYYNVNANVHRGVHFLSQQATELHEQSRETVRRFINACSTNEIVFTRGTTESINLLASSLSKLHTSNHKGQPEVIVSQMEHHSNIVPWQLNGYQLRVIPMSDDGVLDLDAYEQLFTSNTQLVSITHASNVLGTVNPVEEIIRIAHQHGVPVLVDGAQSTPHMAVDMQQLDCDFFAFSGHKIYGPTGVGVLYGKEAWLDKLPPYIKNVSFDLTTFNELPYKFEAGTPDYVGTHALAVALDYVSAIGMEAIHQHECELAQYALQQMAQIPDIHIYGFSQQHPTLNPISFNVGTIHHLDLGTLLDRLGIAVRTGHHCAEPLIHRLGTEGTVRISFGLYNTKEEVDIFVAGLKRVIQMFE